MRDLFILNLILLLLFGACRSTQSIPQANSKFEALLAQMTIEEKVGQMTNIGLMAVCKGAFFEGRDTIEIDTVKLKRLILDHHIGSVQNKGKYPLSPAEWRQFIGTLQNVAINESRLGIPIIYAIDAVHGANYTAGSVLFPHQIAVAATWDPKFAEVAASVAAYETRASGISWNFSPVVDVSKQPLWGRIYETFGEDTYLNQVMGVAMVKGGQGKSVSNPHKVVMCLKHFAGYGMSQSGKDRSPSYIPERMLREIVFPPFKAAIDAGVLSVMLNSGSLNGIPAHADKWLITDILKGELNFKGIVISDWDDVMKLIGVHRVAQNEREAVKMSVLAGLDMCMSPYNEIFAVQLVSLVKDGEVPIERIDDAVRRILDVKFKLGLFENSLHEFAEYPKFGSEEFEKQSYQAALESITLLKNENNTLPLTPNSKILVTGVAANSLNYLNGGWSRTWSGQETEYNDEEKKTILEALKDEYGSNNVRYIQGTDYTNEINIPEAVDLASWADQIVVCLGELPATEKPSDIEDLNMPEAQLKLVRELAKSGKPIILILVEGRPRIISSIEPLVSSILMAYVPGQEAGVAIADILTGNENPSGKLPYTYPRHSGSIAPYDHLRSDEVGTNWDFIGFNPQFEFGFGLSYTTFEYSSINLSTDTLSGNEVLEIEVTVSNTGSVAGKEVIQVYLSDLIATVSPPVKKLKRFVKIDLKPNEVKSVRFSFTQEDFAFVGLNNSWITEPGDFELIIGNQRARFYWGP